MQNLINRLFVREKNAMTGMVTVIKTNSKTGEVISVTKQKNRIMLGTNTGKTLILQRLIGTNTYTLNITHADIGTGTNTPADGNTALQTAVARVAKTTATISSNVATFQFFFSDGDLANGTYNEFGTFVDGTASVSTGKIFNRALFGTPYVKASGEDTTIQLDITIT